MELSLSEENYLKAIYHLSGGGKEQVATNAISERLKTTPASVSDMIRKLSEKGMLHYQKYQGVTVSDEGAKSALRVIRKHRLWEVFLVSKLKFHWDEVHDVAEQLEHINSPLLIGRLDEFLGFPKFDPHGDPIPDEHGAIDAKPKKVLDSMTAGERGKLVALKDTEAGFLQYLDRINLHLGDSVEVVEVMEYDKSMLIEIKGLKQLSISQQVASNLLLDV
jgi:DtxR family Mn-dependent transcriptional regulator